MHIVYAMESLRCSVILSGLLVRAVLFRGSLHIKSTTQYTQYLAVWQTLAVAL